MGSDYKAYVKMVRRNRRREKILSFFHNSKLVWIIDPTPYETHSLQPRSIAGGYKRERLRNTYSWSNIARLQNEKAFKAGLAGIVTAPILASLTIAAPHFVNFTFPIQMAFIFASGLLFVIATSLYIYRVPVFVQKSLEPEQHRRFKPETMREISSSILFEFLKLVRTIEITPRNVDELSNHRVAFKAASMLLEQGKSCFKVGFDVQGQALIEILLFRLANKHGFKIYEEDKEEDGELCLRERTGPRTTIPIGNVQVRNMKLDLVKEHNITVINPERVLGEFGARDLVIKFYDPYIKTLEQIDKNELIEPNAHGLHNILQEEYAEIIVDEMAYWQLWQRPLSRIATLWLYRISLLSFVIFLAYQGAIVWKAVVERI